MDSVFDDKETEMNKCLREAKKGITCEYATRGKVTETSSTRNKGADRYPTDEGRELSPVGKD